MININSKDPVTTSDPSPPVQKLQRIKDLVVQAATDFNEIKTPEVAYNEELANKKAQIGECFRQLREQRNASDETKFEAEIVRYAGELQILQIRGHSDAENTYENQIESVLQSLCDELIRTMGPVVVKKALLKIDVESRKQYLLADLLGCDQATAAEQISVPSYTALDKPHEDKAATIVVDPVQDKKRCAPYDAEQHPARKRQINPGPKAFDQQGKPLQEQEQRSYDTTENDVSVATNNHSFRADANTGPRRLDKSMTCEAAVSPSAGHLVTHKSGNHNNSHKCDVVSVCDADNNCIGLIKQAGPWNNKRVDTILQKCILRPVKIRRGRPFNQHHLDTISDRSKPKGFKIISCMIQATGDVMNQRCQQCEKSQGVFEDCIKLNDDLFQRCGNCEWNRQGCHGASVSNTKTVIPTPSPIHANKRLQRNPIAQHGVANASKTMGRPIGLSPTMSHAQSLRARRSPSSATGVVLVDLDEVRQTDSVVETSRMSPLETLHGAQATDKWVQAISEEERALDEFHTQGFSDADSYTGEAVTRNDWRIHQIKTRLFTSAESVTQYWSWVEDEQYFEHQVLKDTKPVQWGLLREPINFHVQLKEIAQIKYNVTALRVHLVMKEISEVSAEDEASRGDVMVVFKRTRTVRRFLSFCRCRNFNMVKEAPDVIVHRWRNMESEVFLSDGDDDTN